MPKKTTKNTKKTSKKLDSLNQTHGKVEESFEPQTLDQIWGDTGMWKYDTMDGEEYLNSLRGMNKSDLQTHATKVGVVPVDNREMLTSRLSREFKRFVSNYSVPPKEGKEPKKISKEIKKILSEGR
ncbi:hypothetical protein CL634_01185 [bacterium]|nr:hypothetical protein [bacterium]|tara:strand:+ start:360 stop:737 length:378 start_codon:yes stop_codon:yes gene_type:complete